jgi:isoaspartyl peptidase/L-asparaginase-like protein (Ntn-hydrolase superfamily)
MAHAGLGSSPALADGPKKAVDRALAVLEAGGDPLDAAVAGVVVLENDPRFNAGTGSVVRLDAETVQMDAAVMRSDGRFAAIAAIEGVENPVLVARAVLDTPHLLLVGDGATRFARTLGYGAYDPVTPERKRRAQEIQQQLAASSPALPAAWRSFDWRARWNFAKTPEEAGFPPLPPKAGPVDAGADTVGVVVRAADGRFAAALSTGGTSITLRGRVGDVPIFGCGLFAGTAGASAATGDGEFIIRAALARQIDEWLAAGLSPQEAADRAVKLVAEKGGEAGVLVVGRAGMAVASAKPMAWAARESGATVSFGP